MFWRWGANRADEPPAEMVRAVERAASAADRAASAAGAAQCAAERAASTAEEVRNSLIPARPAGWSVAASVAAALALLVLGIWCLVHGADGLRPPFNGGTDRVGSAEVAIEGAKGEPSIPVGLSHYTFPELEGGAEVNIYQLAFREADAGRKFALVLGGPAMLTDIESPAPIRHEALTCPDGIGGFPQDGSCQLITGVVPDGDEVMEGSGSFWCVPSDPEFAGGALLQLEGKAKVSSNLDWAHDVIDLPSLGSVFPPDERADLGFDQGLVLTSACRGVQTPVGVTISDFFEPPTGRSATSLWWKGDGAQSFNHMTATDVGAESTSNLLLAAGGLIAGIGLSMLPGAFRRASSWSTGRAAPKGGLPPAP